jgi:hypothetical protein
VPPLDLSKPVRFGVSVLPSAPKGEQKVKGTVTFFYCHDVEHWCKRGVSPIEIPVSVP